MKQQSLASLTYEQMKKRTKREKFLNEMDREVPWNRLEGVIEPYYPKAGKGRPPKGLNLMLRIYCLHQWYGLSDPGVEEALYDMESMRRFVGLAKNTAQVFSLMALANLYQAGGYSGELNIDLNVRSC